MTEFSDDPKPFDSLEWMDPDKRDQFQKTYMEAYVAIRKLQDCIHTLGKMFKESEKKTSV